MLPEAWQSLPLGQVLTKVIDYRGKAPPKSDVGVRLLTARNVRAGYLCLQHEEFIESDKYSEWMSRGLPCPGDILFTTEAPLGNVALYPREGRYALGQRIVTLRTNDEMASGYLFQLLQSEVGQQLVRERSSGSTAIGIKSRELLKISIPVPPLPEQRKIAEILATWDEAIETTEALLANAEAQKRALMQNLLTGKRRFPEFEGQPWREVRLGEICSIRRGASPRPIGDPKWFADAGRGWVRIADVTACTTPTLLETQQYLTDEGVSKSVAVDPGELIMSICATIGVPRIVGIPVCIHDGFVVFRELSGQYSVEFIYYVLEHVTARLSAMGQPGTQKNLNTTIVSRIEVPSISYGEQARIADALQKADRHIDRIRASLTALRREKSALMQQLLTGKRRVTV